MSLTKQSNVIMTIRKLRNQKKKKTQRTHSETDFFCGFGSDRMELNFEIKEKIKNSGIRVVHKLIVWY